MDKHKIISDMCMTWDHRYYASPDMFKGDIVNKDFTQEYKDGLYRRMKQVFENNIESIMPPTCTPNERAFLDRIREVGWYGEFSEGDGIDLAGGSFISVVDFTGIDLKELVN